MPAFRSIPQQAIAFAPSSVLIAEGWGFSLSSVGEQVTVQRSPKVETQLAKPLSAQNSGTSAALPEVAADAPAARRAIEALERLRRRPELGLDFGFELRIRKSLPAGLGLGTEEAVTVAALVAANSLLDQPLSKEALLENAEAIFGAALDEATRSRLAVSLWGGLVRGHRMPPERISPLPTGVHCVLVAPELPARESVMHGAVQGSEALWDACRQGDQALIRAAFRSLQLELDDRAAHPAYAEVRSAAEEQGILGFSLAGRGPSVFAWIDAVQGAAGVQAAMVRAFQRHGAESVDSWITEVSDQGARVINWKARSANETKE